MRAIRGRGQASGQSLAEFALVVPALMAILFAIIQFGLVFWAQNTLTQTVRDTGRWAATQQAPSCDTGVSSLGAQAEVIAGNSSLYGYRPGEFSSPVLKTDDAGVNSFELSSGTGNMAVAWVHDSGPSSTPPDLTTICPPQSNQAVWHVTIKMNQQIQTFFPGMQLLPGLGTCDSSGCHMTISSTAQFRMEPAP